MTVIDKRALFGMLRDNNTAAAQGRAQLRAQCAEAFARVMAAKPRWEEAARQREASDSSVAKLESE